MKCKLFSTKYRIVCDEYNGYEAQFRYWWMPFYVQCFVTNTATSIEKSKAIIEKHKNPIMYKEC